jgi:hypothetical protein
VLRGAADVAALGVEDHRHAGMLVVDVPDQPLQRQLGAERGEVRDLRLEAGALSAVASTIALQKVNTASGSSRSCAGTSPAPGPGRRTPACWRRSSGCGCRR